MSWKTDLADCLNKRISVIANEEMHTGILYKIGAKSLLLKNVIQTSEYDLFFEKKEKKKFELFDWVKIPTKDIEFIKSAPTENNISNKKEIKKISNK
ncbi:MAG: hypothetical protein ABIH20_06035 [Candidatus Diapherotrites archaeon]